MAARSAADTDAGRPAVIPPSTARSCPFTNATASLDSHTSTGATSPGTPWTTDRLPRCKPGHKHRFKDGSAAIGLRGIHAGSLAEQAGQKWPGRHAVDTRTPCSPTSAAHSG